MNDIEASQTVLFGPTSARAREARGARHYVPILKTLKGELDALACASGATWRQMMPLLEVATRRGEDQQILVNLPRRVASSVGAHPFFLDLSLVKARSMLTIGRGSRRTRLPAAVHVLGECGRLGLDFVPVATLGMSPRQLGLVQTAITGDQRGVCIRIPIAGVLLPSDMTFAKTIRDLLEQTGARRADADLLLDLRYIGTPGFDAQDVANLIDSVPDVAEWRSLTVAGTVIPPTLSGFPEWDVTPLERHDWRIYTELVRLRMARTPDFGDYAVQHPDRPESSGPGMRANIRYTAESHVLIARGRSILEHGNAQYRDLCAMLAPLREFAGARFSWGDQAIVDCANGVGPVGSQHHWRAVGTSHHLRKVTEDLARLFS